jgi:hypothetical protein
MARYQLKHPLALGTSTLAHLTLRDHVIAADYLAFDQRGGVAQRVALIASVAGTDEAVVRKLHGADYVALERRVDALMQAAEVEALADEPKAGQTGDGGKPLSEAQKK